MRRAVRAVALGSLLAAACAAPVVSPSPVGVERVSVLPPVNRTGDELLLEPPPLLFWEKESQPRLALPGDLAWEAQQQLARKGFEVTPPSSVASAMQGRTFASSTEAASRLAAAGLDAPALWMKISRFETDRSGTPTFVNAEMDLALIDPHEGKVLWQAHWPARPVRVGGAGSDATAYRMAGRWLLEHLLADLEPSPSAR